MVSNQVVEAGFRLNFTSTATLAGPGALLGIFVASASATPTLKVADSNGTIVNTFTPSAGTYYKIPSIYSGTLTITVGGTVDATAFYQT